jgi:hypothetical protein
MIILIEKKDIVKMFAKIYTGEVSQGKVLFTLQYIVRKLDFVKKEYIGSA